MFALGHMQTFDDAEVMSALAPIHDHHWALVHFNLTELRQIIQPPGLSRSARAKGDSHDYDYDKRRS